MKKNILIFGGAGFIGSNFIRKVINKNFFVVNIGDLLMQWTNDLWVSNFHRVCNPPKEVAETARRISVVFFHQPNYNALIESIPTCVDHDNPPRYPPVRSGDYRDQKYQDTLIDSATT